MHIYLILLFLAILQTQIFAKDSTIYSADVPDKYIALTFDDGPHKILTPKLLDALKKTNTSVTFFVMGFKAVMHPGILKRATIEGHEIGNHVWDHPVLTQLDWNSVVEQVESTNKAIFNATGIYPKVMRPPYGNTKPRLNNRINDSLNERVIMWSLDTRDWTRPAPENIINHVLEKTKAGDILLCHDIHPGTIQAIPVIIENLIRNGFKFLTVSQMLEYHDAKHP